MCHKHLLQFLREFLHGGLIVGITDVEYLAVTFPVFIIDNLRETGNTVVDVGKTSFLHTSVNKTYRLAEEQVADKLGQHAGTALFFRIGYQFIKLVANPVKWPK
jgi:hypothetical protein